MKILIFGVTGNIGTQALDIIKFYNHDLVGITYYNNYELASKIINDFNIKYIFSIKNNKLNTVESYLDLIVKSKPDLVINAISGYHGVEISELVIKQGIDLALANKETFVIAGKFIKSLAMKNNVNIYPIDSEHSSIYDILINSNKEVKNILITCSGGSFYNLNDEELKNVNLKQALKHPNWSMGKKITIDSSTLMNKCFEIIEAYWLFDNKNIIAIYHPQSIVHGIVQFCDNSYFLNASTPDMRGAIKLAINKYKSTNESNIKPLDFKNLTLNFDYIDSNKYKSIKWAYEIINDENNSLGTIVNVSNDIAVNKFLNEEIRFNEIIPFIENNIQKYKNTKIKDIDEIKQLIRTIEESSK